MILPKDAGVNKMSEALSLSSQVLALEEKLSYQQKHIDELKKKIKTRNDAVSKLRLALRVEQFKNKLLTTLIEQKTDLKIADILREEDDTLRVNTYADNRLNVVVQNELGEEKNYAIATKKDNKTGQTFRTSRTKIEEDPVQRAETIKRVDEEMEKKIAPQDIKPILDEIQQCIKNISTTRTYTADLKKIKDKRGELIVHLPLDQYVKHLQTQNQRLIEIWTNKKSQDRKKIEGLIGSALSALDRRLLAGYGYHDIDINPDEIKLFDLCLNNSMNFPKEFKPFSLVDFYPRVNNYGLALFPINHILNKVLNNPYNCSNLIYSILPKSTDADPFSYYSLDRVEDGVRYWKTECRLFELSRNLAQNIRQMCITLFRRIYYEYFHDNKYRADYRKASVFENDCQQLISNIIALSKSATFRQSLQQIVKANCSLQPSQFDRFDHTIDIKFVAKQCKNDQDDIEEAAQGMKQLFDELTDEEVRTITDEAMKI